MRVTAVQTPVIQPRQSLLPILQQSLPRPLRDGDIICVASKVVALEQGRIVELASVEPSPAARQARRLDAGKDPETYARWMELILREADHVFASNVIWLTLKDGILIANAGMDMSNAPLGHVVLWPHRPWEWARRFWQDLRAAYGILQVGVILTDARSIPLRRGFTGMALAFWGFEGLDVQRGQPDLFGRPLQYTERMVADGLAAAAVVVGGEANERTPFVLIEEAPVTFTERELRPEEILVPADRDIFSVIYNEEFKAAAGARPSAKPGITDD